ncbi:MAG TPA: Trp biosynthesis-associated membrane protein [Aeromicrobium sp.]|nr:Trp biosynthesis-associated membrane protein [Aeromicrobium sp.]
MTRRLYAPVVIALMAVGALGLYAVTRTWLSASVSTPGLPADQVTVSGHDAAPVLVAVALVVAAGGLAVVAAGGWLRQLIGLVIAALSVLAAVAAYRVDAAGQPLAEALKASPAFVGAVPPAAERHAWQTVAWLAFVVAAVLGLAVAALSREWPRMGRRYASPAAIPPADPTDGDDPAAVWKAFDEGRDPTQ